MSNNQILTQVSEAQPGVDFCQTSYNGTDGQIVNSYKCNRKHFSAPDMWNIQKQKRQATVGANIIVL